MTQRRKVKRARLVAKPAGAVMLFALLLLPLSARARRFGHLLRNGSFKSGRSGWTVSDAAFTIARVEGHAANDIR